MKQNIVIQRHGFAKYQTLKVNCNKKTYYNKEIDSFLAFTEQVKDLQEDKIDDLQKKIKEFFVNYWEKIKDKKIVIWVSPYGRTLQTASELVSYMQQEHYNIKKISIVDKLQEVEWFEWQLLNSCVNWWEVEIDGEKIILDKSITNPDNLSITDYFFQGKYRTLNIHHRIQNIETYEEITKRSKETLSRVLSTVDDNTFVIMVTHQWRTDHIMIDKNKYKNGWLNPWEFLIYPPIKEG